jgi:hypothetical protein
VAAEIYESETAEIHNNTSILGGLNGLKEWQIKGNESDQN